MIVSRRWLEALLGRTLDAREVAEQLTMHAAAVDGVVPLHQDLGDVLIGRVLEVTKHPNADVFKQVYETFTTGDMEKLKGLIALDVVWHVPGKNIIYPAIGVTASGRGVVALTLSGPDNFPSAAYAAIDAQVGMGAVTIVADGAATEDGFTSYKQQLNPGASLRPRWGDYGSAAVDGNSIWIASEYIAQSCNYTDWGGPFFAGGTGDNLLGTCGGASHGPGKRTALANWSTRISKLTP